MPKTKIESVVFTAITAWTMVYIMTLYNKVIEHGVFVNETFWIALKGMWIEYVFSFVCAFFISSRVAKHFAFKIVNHRDRQIAIIFAIQTFTVVSQVTLMSILGVVERYGFTNQFIPNYISTFCLNFLMAFPAQLLISGPLARFLFRLMFRRVNGKDEKKVEEEMLDKGIAE